MAKSGKRPSHRLKLLDKVTGRSGEVGAGWQNKDGSISVRLNMGVVLSEVDLEGRSLTLFPADREYDDRNQAATYQEVGDGDRTD